MSFGSKTDGVTSPSGSKIKLTKLRASRLVLKNVLLTVQTLIVSVFRSQVTPSVRSIGNFDRSRLTIFLEARMLAMTWWRSLSWKSTLSDESEILIDNQSGWWQFPQLHLLCRRNPNDRPCRSLDRWLRQCCNWRCWIRAIQIVSRRN